MSKFRMSCPDCGVNQEVERIDYNPVNLMVMWQPEVRCVGCDRVLLEKFP